MRVTLISPFDPHPEPTATRNGHVGGVERVFGQLARNLARRGHDVTLVCSTEGPAGRAVEEGVRIVRDPRWLTLFRTPVARLSRNLTADADIVHVAATYPFTTPAVLRRAWTLDVASVLDFHFEPAPGTPLGRLAARLYRHIGPRTYPLADAVLVRSHAYAHAARSLAKVPQERWRVVPNGVDTARFRPTGPVTKGDYLLFVGRLVPYKGVAVLLHALSRLRQNFPLWVAGDGPLRKRLEALGRRLRVDLRFLGHVPDEDLPALYRGARLTVLPSVTAQEAFGMAILESMACGTPVVASALPGVEELARLGGLTARPGDPDSLAQQIRHATESTGLPRGQALSTPIHATYSWNAVTDRLVAVYEEVLSRRSSTPAAGTRPEVTTPANPLGHAVL